MPPWPELVTTLGVIIAMLCNAVALLRNGRKDVHDASASNAEMQAKLSHISTGVDDIRLEQRAMRGEVSDLATRVTRTEERVNDAHKRLDRLGVGRPNE